jgi:hypothetical protein
MAMAAAQAPRHGGGASVRGPRARRPRLDAGSCSPRTAPPSSVLSISGDPRPSSAAPPRSARRRLLMLLAGEGEARRAPAPATPPSQIHARWPRADAAAREVVGGDGIDAWWALAESSPSLCIWRRGEGDASFPCSCRRPLQA